MLIAEHLQDPAHALLEGDLGSTLESRNGDVTIRAANGELLLPFAWFHLHGGLKEELLSLQRPRDEE